MAATPLRQCIGYLASYISHYPHTLISACRFLPSMQLTQPSDDQHPTPVPVYDLDEIITNLHLDNKPRPTQTQQKPDIVRTPPRSPPPVAASAAPSPSRPLCRVESPRKVVYTEHCLRSEAGKAILSTPHMHVKAVRRCAKCHPPRAAYMVFWGRRIGVFYTWAAVEEATKRFPGAICQGYANEELATAAFALAERKGWTYMSNSPSPAAFP
ncbi:hypothetical protein DFH06DRAFT_1326816 [Mycena polygramma]|nr:hypothetical protein DFH06DRAFT_1326816 [Mycena polygramma]